MKETQSPTTPTQMSTPVWRQLRWNLVLICILLAVMLVAIVVAITTTRKSEQVIDQTIQNLESIAELKENNLSLWLEDSKTMLRLFLSEPARADKFKALASATLLPDQDTPSLETERESLNQLLHDAVESQDSFKEIFFYNSDGYIVAGSNPATVGKIVTRQPYFADSLARDLVQTPYYAMGTNELTMFVTRSLVDDQSGQTAGVLAGRLDLTEMERIMTEREGLGKTGETYLVSPESNYLVTPSRFKDEDYVLTRAYHSEGIDQALHGVQGSGTYLSYRHPPQPVIGVYRWVDELQVALLAERSKAEVQDPYVQARNLSIFLAFVSALAAFAVGLFSAIHMFGSQPAQFK